MFCETCLVFVSFVAMAALERPLSRVRSHVPLQMTRLSTCVVALATLVWLFSRVLPHHVYFQFTSRNAGKLTHCASVKLFPRVGPFVMLHFA